MLNPARRDDRKALVPGSFAFCDLGRFVSCHHVLRMSDGIIDEIGGPWAVHIERTDAMESHFAATASLAVPRAKARVLIHDMSSVRQRLRAFGDCCCGVRCAGNNLAACYQFTGEKLDLRAVGHGLALEHHYVRIRRVHCDGLSLGKSEAAYLLPRSVFLGGSKSGQQKRTRSEERRVG